MFRIHMLMLVSFQILYTNQSKSLNKNRMNISKSNWICYNQILTQQQKSLWLSPQNHEIK